MLKSVENHITGKRMQVSYGVRRCEVVQVIKTVCVVGAGVDGDPVREATQYWNMDGSLLCEFDPCMDAEEKQ